MLSESAPVAGDITVTGLIVLYLGFVCITPPSVSIIT